MKKCFLLLGSPRCGSSCTTACFSFCNVSLGLSVSLKTDIHNPRGYFENDKILNFNRKVLNSLGVKWDGNPLTPEQISDSLKFQDELCLILEDDYQEDVCAIKDMRIGLLQDLYLSALNSYELKLVIIKRNKSAVVASMLKMFPWMNESMAAQNYDKFYDAIELLKGKLPFFELQFEKLLAEPINTVQELCKFSEIRFLPEFQDKIVNFIDKKLVHAG